MPDCQWIVSTLPPLPMMRPCLLGRSRSSMSRVRISSGPGGGFVEQLPERLVAQVHIQAPEALDVVAGQRAGGVDDDFRHRPGRGGVGGQPFVASPPGDRRAQAGQVPQPGRRRERSKRRGVRVGEVYAAGFGVEDGEPGGDWCVREPVADPGQGLPVFDRGPRAPGAGGLMSGEVCLGRVGERRRRRPGRENGDRTHVDLHLDSSQEMRTSGA